MREEQDRERSVGPRKMKPYKKYILLLAAVGVVAWFISTFWLQLALIQGDSMEPAFHSGQLVLLRKNVNDFYVGDVVAFRSEPLKGILIKRIAAGPGDTIQIIDGTLYLNGAPETEAIEGKSIEFAGSVAEPVTLQDEEYFVLGDNVARSKDSRYHEIGCVRQMDIIGKVVEIQGF